MSVIINIYGADKESDEYKAALKMKEIIVDGIPDNVVGEIVLFASATIMGQAVKDIDLLVLGELSNYSVTADFCLSNGERIHDNVDIYSFCTTVEIKRHDINGVSRNGTDLYVKYKDKKHCVTEQSNKQKYALLNFLKERNCDKIYVTNVIWFTQITSRDIKELLTDNGKVLRSNVLGRDFTFKDFMQLLLDQSNVKPLYGHYSYGDSRTRGSVYAIRNAMDFFSTTKKQVGEMTRRRIEQMTGREFNSGAIAADDGKLAILRGRAGTGKTVGLIQTAIKLVDERQARVLMLTYNKALVSDIRRILAFAELPDMFEEQCLHINTMHSYFFALANTVLYDGKLGGELYLNQYTNVLKELLQIISDDPEFVKELCLVSTDLDWDYVLIDEAQDWSEQEKQIIMMLYDNNHIIVADGGTQFVRGIDVCDWSSVRQRNSIKLKYCLRQKNNLISFLNAYTALTKDDMGLILSKNKMPGGRIVITSDDRLGSFHREEIELLKNVGNDPYDMIYFVPHSMVRKVNGQSEFGDKARYEANGVYFWDGVSSKNRNSYSINMNEVRLLQYDSARGLEGWTVVCVDFDVFLQEKERNYTDIPAQALALESPEEKKQTYMYNWAMIPLTRAIDTIIITLEDPKSEVGAQLRAIAEQNPDYVHWIF